MKRFSLRHILLLCLPFVLIAVVAAIKIQANRQQRFYFSQPFAPRLEVVRAKVPSATAAGPGLFEVAARCSAIGGNGESSWLVRAELFDISGKAPREIWNSQKLIVPTLVGYVQTDAGLSAPVRIDIPDRFTYMSGMSWRFRHYEHHADHLKMVVEAVAVPFPPENQSELGTQSFNIQEATAAQIAAARQLPGAHYLRNSMILDAKDNDKYWYSAAEMNR